MYTEKRENFVKFNDLYFVKSLAGFQTRLFNFFNCKNLFNSLKENGGGKGKGGRREAASLMKFDSFHPSKEYFRSSR